MESVIEQSVGPTSKSSTSKRRFILIGTSGGGKSSCINQIVGEKVITVGDE